ncbi:transcriptional regulator [Humibacillus sp. DSM 29435]|uniref:PadR family transcriptional regulator n=1 Tax=Humibacillus sp. DSM 29435 TaxID=1869167 RepID=UPI00087287F4|nr:PadR family transcriptional regulator [Humibacillus sp. DSM 29435]OFE17873.1 transcriptional regulator [Humibacillus sp. DSM 29435]
MNSNRDFGWDSEPEHEHDHHREHHGEHGGPRRGGWPEGGRGFGPGGPGGPRRGSRGPGFPGGAPPWLHLMRQFGAQFGGPAFEREFGRGFAREYGGRRGPKARRGDVRAAILDVLAGDEMNGYQLIQQISERTDGAWKPSPGSVYPTVQQLEDEGLVEGREVEGRRLLRLTDDGRHYVEEHADEMAATWRPFEEASSHERTAADDMGDLMPVTTQVMSAMWQIMTTGTSQQRAEATEILSETRRKLYGLLAEGDPKGTSE